MILISNTIKMRKMNDLTYFVLAINVIILSCLPLINAHVALTYPPARKYDLDFLDNSRTKGPCGMPKGKFIHNLQWFEKCLNAKVFPKSFRALSSVFLDLLTKIQSIYRGREREGERECWSNHLTTESFLWSI